jgi:aspartate racemase
MSRFPASVNTWNQEKLKQLTTNELHSLVYNELLPTAIQYFGRDEAESLILKFKVLGGLGPAATVDFLQELHAATPAKRDREHLRLDVVIDPMLGQIADATPIPRTQYALDKLLGDNRPTAFCLACNTAHWRIEHLSFDSDSVSFVSMVHATANAIANQMPRNTTVGLLATHRMIQSQLYQARLCSQGLIPVIPSTEDQRLVDIAIYGGEYQGRHYTGIKGTDSIQDSTELVQWVVDKLRSNYDIKAVCLACTELPLVFGDQLDRSSKGSFDGLYVFSSTRELAKEFLKTCLSIQVMYLTAAISTGISKY